MKSSVCGREGCRKNQRNKGREAVIVSNPADKQKFQEDVALVALLKACAKKKDLHRASIYHADILKRGLLKHNPFVGSTLVNLYAKCGALAKAREVFDELGVRDKISWTALIAGYAQHGYGMEALKCFGCMQREGFSADGVTFVCILKACGSIGAADKGEEIHAEVVRRGLLHKDILIGTALVDMYAKCGALEKAREVFDELPVRNAVSWNALITGYAQHEHGEEALNCFERMQDEGLTPNAVTFVCILKACGSIRAVDKGKKIHAEIVKERLHENNILIGTALVDMYARCDEPEKAQEVFNKLPVRDVVSWNALIAGYAQHGHDEEALHCFEKMQTEGFSPNAVTFVSLLRVCGNIGAADKGEELHAGIMKVGLLRKNILVGTALVDMYAKCGALEKAQEVFDELPVRDVVSWTVLITAYGQLGLDDIVLDLFNKMTGEGIEPSLVTFTVVLNACSHSGLLEKAQMYFESMSVCYGIVPISEHFTCMVDLYGRAGHFDKALAMVKKMPTSDYLPVWNALMGACGKWGNVKLGRFAFENAVRLDGKDSAAYVCMSNIYAAAAMEEEAAMIEAMRVKNEAWKKIGC